jgi:hypothetical protein
VFIFITLSKNGEETSMDAEDIDGIHFDGN